MIAKRLVSLGLISSLLVPTFAFAQTDPAPAPAQAQPAAASGADDPIAHFNRGLELYQEQDYNGALIELRRAYELAPTYKMLFNIGQVCYQLNDYACALRSFEEYLKEGSGSITPERRAEVDREIKKLVSRIGRLEVVTNVPGVEISIDDVLLGTTPFASSLIVSAGKRRITATKDGYVAINRVVEVAGTDSMRLELNMIAVSGSDRTPQYESRWNTISWIGLGATVAFGATAGVTGGLALGASNDLEEQRFSGATPPQEVKDQQSKVDTLATVSDVFLGASIVTLAATLVYTFVHKPKLIEATPAAETAKTKVKKFEITPGASASGAFVAGRFW